MSEHTPGPWEASEALSGSENHRGWRILQAGRSGSRWAIGEVYPRTQDGSPEAEACARLIAAAPDLLAALEGAIMRDVYRCFSNGCGECVNCIGRAAIAKAVGATEPQV